MAHSMLAGHFQVREGNAGSAASSELAPSFLVLMLGLSVFACLLAQISLLQPVST